jgi:DNA-binding SARP family transcriptional activator/DNA-binding CsgD family transcriptional regulator
VLIRLLGPVDALIDGVPRPVQGLRRKSLLAVLALRRGEIVSTDALTEIVWGPQPAAFNLNTLQRHISHLRKVLGNRDVIVPRPPGYLLQLDAQSVDVEVAEHLIKQATRSVEPTRRAEHLRAALRLWRGQPLADVAGASWLDEQAQHLGQLWLQASRALIEARLALGENTVLIPELERLAREHPLDEQLHADLMLALYRSGRQADALSVFRRLRRTLGEELGIDPSPPLRELESAVLRQDVVLQSAPAPLSPGREVRLGDSDVLGRDAELAALHTAVADAGPPVFIVGEAGIGKSRLAAEAVRIADEAGMTVLRGRAASAAVQFRPLNEALLSTLRRSGPPDDAQLRPYLPALARLVPEWRVHAPADVDDSLVVIAEAVLRLLINLGRRGGCLLLLEDLHDADDDTLAVVDYLLDNAGGHPLLVIATMRPTPGPAIDLVRAAKRRRAATVLELTKLGDEDVRRLAGACLGVTGDQVPEPALDRLLAAADGVPLHIEELLAGLVDDGVLVHEGTQWTMYGPATGPMPESLAATLAGRVERLDPQTVAVLRTGALLGRRFPVWNAAAAAGVSEQVLLRCLRTAFEAQLIVPMDNPLWYEFRHVLIAEALRTRMLPIERAALAYRAAESLEAEADSGFDGWERVAGELWVTAGEPRRAAQRLGTAGRRAVASGAVSTGISLLERALSMTSTRDEPALPLVAALVDAYAGAGRIEDAYALSARFDVSAAHDWQAGMHLRLAKVAEMAGHWQRGLDEVARARALQGSRLDPALDAVEAELAFGNPSADRYARASRLAQRALRDGQAGQRPEVVCSALETLGRIARLRDLAEADTLYERGLAEAESHGLAGWRINMLYNLGADDGIRRADLSRLTEALAAAEQAGAVVTALDISLETAVVQICRGEFDAADATTRAVEEIAARLRLTRTRLIALGERIMVASHQGRRNDAYALLASFRELSGEDEDFASAVHGFGLAIGHLLHEDHAAAIADLDAAVAREARQPTSYLSFVHGPHLLLSVLSGRQGQAEYAALAESVQAQAGWNQVFILLAQAVITADSDAMSRFLHASQAYPTARNLGLRLVAPHAIEHGWGEPTSWLRTAEAYFHSTAPPVARACRELLRQAGTPVPQHRQGSAVLPRQVRERGISVREFEVLNLVAARLSNNEIGRRLFLSPRTVEKHVASLLAKTGAATRPGLIAFAADVSGSQESG